MVAKALILTHCDQDVKIIMKTDKYDFISSETFSQSDNNKLLHLVIFFYQN